MRLRHKTKQTLNYTKNDRVVSNSGQSAKQGLCARTGILSGCQASPSCVSSCLDGTYFGQCRSTLCRVKSTHQLLLCTLFWKRYTLREYANAFLADARSGPSSCLTLSFIYQTNQKEMGTWILVIYDAHYKTNAFAFIDMHTLFKILTQQRLRKQRPKV